MHGRAAETEYRGNRVSPGPRGLRRGMLRSSCPSARSGTMGSVMSKTGRASTTNSGGKQRLDPVTGAPGRPGGAGMYLHWEGRKGYRTQNTAPRVLEPVPDLSFGDPANRIIEGDNLQVMVSLRSQYQGNVDVAYLDPPYNTGKKDFAYSDRRYRDPNADAEDMVYV